MICRAFFLALLLAAGLAQAQQYRWVDKDGSVKYSDAPPPAWAKDVRKQSIAPSKPAAAPVPFEVARLQKDFPVTLYTSPDCKESCASARAALNRRGVPFEEVQVSSPETHALLTRIAGAAEVPTLQVGRGVHRGFELGAFDALLDTASYPRTGLLPPRSQKAPPAPEGNAATEAPAKIAKPQSAEAPRKSGPYDTSGLQGPPPKPGQYGVPGETK
jgi:glutaredoxin